MRRPKSLHSFASEIRSSARCCASLAEQGWTVLDGPAATRTPESYREFITQSRGEISTAKNVYVAMNTGWFSCRTACYLAAGRPAVVQDTGFSKHLAAGNGILAFDTVEQAAAAVESVEEDYAEHAVAARDFATTHFGSDGVLSAMLDAIFAVK